MIIPSRIQTEVNGTVGWNQPTLSGYDIVNAVNLASSSGLKFDRATFLVSIKNIKETQEDKDITDAEFNTLLTNMQNDVILDVCNKVALGESDYIQTNNLYPYEKTFTNTLDINTNFVGFQIEPTRNVNIISRISSIELAFDSNSTFYIYLFNSNLKSYIQRQEVTVSAGESKIIDLGWIISDNQTYKGGNFYIGYFEDDISGAKPYKRDFELSTYKFETEYFYIEPVKLTHSSNILDISSVINQSDTGGLNIIIDVYVDYSEFFIRNKNKLAFAIQMQMAEKVLDMIRYSTRLNFDERATKQMISDIKLQLIGYKDDHVYIEGILSKLNRAIYDLKKDFFYKSKIERKTLTI